MKIYTRTKQKDGVTKLYIKPKIEGKPKWICLGMDVAVKDWDKTYSLNDENNLEQSDVKVANLMRKLGYSEKLQSIENGLRGLRDKNNLTVETAHNLIETIVLADVRAEQERQQERMAKAEEAKRKADEAKRKAELEKQKDVKRYIDKFVASLTDENSNSMTKKGQAYKKRSILIWQQFLRVFSDFYKAHKVGSWDDVNKDYTDKFKSYLEKRYMMSTWVRYISCFRTIMGRAFADGLRTKPIAQDMIYRPVVEAQDAATEIYLTANELNSLYNLELSGLKEQVRDLFLIGCFCGQRFSDYKRIDSTCIGVTAKGTQVIRLVQVKTGKAVVVPIIDERLISLLEKYGYEVPQLNDVVFNRYIKMICKEFSLTVPSLAEYVPTILNKKEKEAEDAGKAIFVRDKHGNVIKHRYELVCSHTARRTCITLMHLSGKFTIKQMMSVSGHTKYDTFSKYLKQSLDDDADSVAEAAGNDGLF